MTRDKIVRKKGRSIAVMILLVISFTTGFAFETKTVENSAVFQITTNTPAALPTPTELPDYNSLPSASYNLQIFTSNQTIQQNGTVIRTGYLSIGPYSFGTLELTSPSTLKLGQTGVIRLLITPDSVMSNLPPVNAPALSSPSNAPSSEAQNSNYPSHFLQLNDRLLISSLMVAELKAIKFDIVSSSSAEKSIDASMSAEWVWLVEPLAPGIQSLILSVSIPIVDKEYFSTQSVQTLKNIPIEIGVEVTPTPEPTQTLKPTASPEPTQTPTPENTPTPLPVITRIAERLIENVSTVFVAVIGLIGVLAGVYVSYMNAKKAKVEKPTTKKAKKK